MAKWSFAGGGGQTVSGGQTTPFYETPGLMAVPCAFRAHISDEQGYQLNSALVGIAVQLNSAVEYAWRSLGLRKTAVGTAGNLNPAIWDSDRALEPNGERNDGISSGDADMTSGTAPSPNVVTATDEAVGAAWHAMDGTITGSSLWYSAGAPSEGSPISFMRDYGEGNASVKNKLGIATYSATNYMPEDFKVQGSNESSPDVSNDTHWTDLGTFTGEVMIGAAYKWLGFTNSTAYRAYRIRITKTNDSGLIIVRQIALITAQEETAPGSEVQALDAIASGADVAAWIGGDDFATAFQASNHTDRWLVIMGSAGADISLSHSTCDGTKGSGLHPAIRQCKVTTDGGVTWSLLTHNDVRSYLNFIVNPSPNMASQMVVGANVNRGIYLPGVGTCLCPEAGLLVNCESLDTVPDDPIGTQYYRLYITGADGVLTGAEASYTAVIVSDEGFLVKTGETTKRLLAFFGCREIQTGVAGPIWTADMPLVDNLFNSHYIPVAKPPPFSALTQGSVSANSIVRLNGDDSFKVLGLAVGRRLLVTVTGVYQTSAGVSVRFGLNNDAVPHSDSSAKNTAGNEADLSTMLSNGFFTIVPLVVNATAGAVTVTVWSKTSSINSQAGVAGTLTRI